MKRIITIAALILSSLSLNAQTIDPKVTQDTLNSTICVSGYTKTVRPSVYYTNKIKKQRMLDAGIPWENRKQYQLDHIMALTLGGHPSDPANLQLLILKGEDGAYKKDAVSRKLNKLVCSGQIRLEDAQSCIMAGWKTCNVN